MMPSTVSTMVMRNASNACKTSRNPAEKQSKISRFSLLIGSRSAKINDSRPLTWHPHHCHHHRQDRSLGWSPLRRRDLCPSQGLHMVEHATLKELMTPHSYLWKSRRDSAWHCRVQNMPSVSRSVGAHGEGSSQAIPHLCLADELASRRFSLRRDSHPGIGASCWVGERWVSLNIVFVHP